ncbi:hypothetical protein AB4Z01_08665 [Inquilinus sp. YAF38]|uniref:hypothetical protein n=1 Tax=Inquilinus sp. YAF38 TaxID=3233084 RepID=UPI003F8DB822
MPFAWITAILLGALVPAAISSAAVQMIVMLPVAFVFALGHALILGLPIALIYRAKRWQWPGLAVATGFLIGVIPIGIFTWPVRRSPGSTAWANGVLVSVDGIPTLVGWLDFLRFLGMFGALGASGALAFWLTLRWTGALDEPSSE